jgi:hypothetical protein
VLAGALGESGEAWYKACLAIAGRDHGASLLLIFLLVTMVIITPS